MQGKSQARVSVIGFEFRYSRLYTYCCFHAALIEDAFRPRRLPFDGISYRKTGTRNVLKRRLHAFTGHTTRIYRILGSRWRSSYIELYIASETPLHEHRRHRSAKGAFKSYCTC